MASFFCHAVASTAQVGLTRALGAMPKFIVSLAIAVLLTLSGAAQACALFPDSPEEIFKNHGSVFLARPLAMSPSPEEIERLPTSAPYQQTAIWQVVRVWKGDHRAGDTFVQFGRFDSRDPCSGWGITRSYEPQIFSLVAGSTFHQHYGLEAAHAAPQFDALKHHERSPPVQ